MEEIIDVIQEDSNTPNFDLSVTIKDIRKLIHITKVLRDKTDVEWVKLFAENNTGADCIIGISATFEGKEVALNKLEGFLDILND